LRSGNHVDIVILINDSRGVSVVWIDNDWSRLASYRSYRQDAQQQKLEEMTFHEMVLRALKEK